MSFEYSPVCVSMVSSPVFEAPEDFPYVHNMEGKDDMPAHIRSALTSTSEAIPVVNGSLSLGTWQGIYVWEHRDQSHNRNVMVSIVGE